MDGWSGSRLLGEVLERYAGRLPASLAGRYRDYIAWLQRQDQDAAGRFWKEQLAELDAPTRLMQALAGQVKPVLMVTAITINCSTRSRPDGWMPLPAPNE